MFEDAKKVIRIRKLKKGSQYNGQRRAVNTMAKEGQSIQRSKKGSQYNGQRQNDKRTTIYTKI